ncbi:MAG: DUF1295 domain-containing protein [Gammaproteobacteria bacterium]|nr:DUF1295 domain-containing protein [Gammaproteobacteria bacterium]
MNNTRAAAGILGAIVGGAVIAVAGSIESVALAGIPVFGLCVAGAYVAQWIGFAPALLFKTERHFDLVGSATFVAAICFAYASRDAFDARSLLITAMVTIWAARLGTFLFHRIRRDGFDRRFARLKTAAIPFLMTWTLQGLWISVTLSCALAAVTATHTAGLDWTTAVGTAIWGFGLAIEVAADRQKQRFRAAPENANTFIDTGLWAYCRHPNYLGEILLWTGMAVVALPALQGWSHMTLISPVFVWVLLVRISGVPMLEARADRKWGAEPAYQAYKARTPALVPSVTRLVRRGNAP